MYKRQDQNPEDAVVLNQQVIAKILEVDPIHHRVVVAIIEYPEDGIPEPGTEPKLSELPRLPEPSDVEIDMSEVDDDN